MINFKKIKSKKMEPEKEDGNIEYKLKLVDKNPLRIEQIATQMRYRTEEGDSECIYIVGVTDDGKLEGVTDDEFVKSFNTLSLAADKNNYSMTKISEKIVDSCEDKEGDKKVYEILIRENNENKYIDIKVVVSGNVNAGKSSLIGTLITGRKDDGRGSARLSVFNFKHEVSSGRTSSVSQQILGFDGKGNVTNYCNVGNRSWPEIVKASSKIVSFFDLAGHKKYLKTTILGMTASSPDVCMIVVGGNMGITNMTREHLFLCFTLAIPFVFVITKIDICKDRQDVFKDTLVKVNKLIKLPGIRRVPFKISSNEDVLTAATNIHSLSIVPVFHTSNVTGEGIDYIKQFLNLVGRRPENSKKTTNTVECYIESTFYVNGVGTVVGGQLVSGTIKVGDKLQLGPNNGNYQQVQVRSIHCKRVPVQEVTYGCYVCLALKKIDRKNIRRGNVLVSIDGNAIVGKEFFVDVIVMRSHSTTIKVGYEPIVHVGNVRQSAKIISITNKISSRKTKKDTYDNDSILRTGDRATVKFMFLKEPEYIKSGQRILFCEGTTKATGVVV